MEILIGIGAVVLFVLMVIGISIIFGKRRTNALKKIADTLNLTFQGDSAESLLELITDFSLLSKGYSPEFRDVMAGRFKEMDIFITDYKYNQPFSRLSPSQTVIVICSGLLHLPSFNIEHESLAHKINLAVGYEKIDFDFDEHPVFSKQYVLQGPDEEAIRKFFTPEIIACFEQHKKLCAEGRGNVLLVFRHDHLVSLKNYRSFLAEALEVYMLMKNRK